MRGRLLREPFGIGLGSARDAEPMLIVIPVLGAISGYVSWTRSSIAYVVTPPLEGPAALAVFLAEKDLAHSRLAGRPVTHTERVVDGRRGYAWDHGGPRGFRYFAAWFPEPVHSVRVECIAKRQSARFRRLCAEAMRSLRFH